MPASPLRRLVLTSAAAVLALGMLAGCSGQRTPSSYTSAVKDDFIAGCTAMTKDDGKAKPSKSDCECAYNQIADDVPFSEFKSINEAQIEKPSPLPASFTKAYKSCVKGVDIVSAQPTTASDSGK